VLPVAVEHHLDLVLGMAGGHLQVCFRWRKLSPGWLALTILVGFCHDQHLCGRTRDNGISASTVCRRQLEIFE
jgi:hypothetical protein